MLRYPSIQGRRKSESKVLIVGRGLNEGLINKSKASGFFHNYFGTKTSKERRLTLGIADFICISISWEISIMSLVNYDDLAVKWGGFLIHSMYLILCLAVAIPLQMSLLFLGRYTKQGYFMFWDICPMFRGTIVATSMLNIFMEALNLSFAGLAIQYISSIARINVPWVNCDFKGAAKDCRPMYPRSKYTQKCCYYQVTSNCTERLQLFTNVVLYSTMEYFRAVIVKAHPGLNHEEGFGFVQTPWVYTVAINWFIVFVCMTLGFKRFQLLMTKITATVVATFMLPLLLVTVFIGSQYELPYVFKSNWSNIFKPQVWYSLLVHILSRLTPGNYIYLGSVAPDSLKPTTIVFLLFGLKYMIQLFIASWRCMGIHLLAEHYKIEDIQCIPTSGGTTLITLIPDILSRVPVPQLPLFFWFIGMWFIGLCPGIYTLTAFVESFIEAVPATKNVKVYFCAVVSLACFLLNLAFITSIYRAPLATFKEIFLPHTSILLFFIFFITLFTYSLRRMAGDYYFTYGEPLNSYWIHTIKYSGFYIMVIIVYRHLLIIKGTTKLLYIGMNNISIHMMFYVIYAICITPIIIYMVFTYLKYKNIGEPVRAVIPSRNWGPPTDELKQMRAHFRPQREFHYVTDNKTCNHNCLLISERLKELQNNQTST